MARNYRHLSLEKRDTISACLLAGSPLNSGGTQRKSIASCDAIFSMMRTLSLVVISVVPHTGKPLRAGSVAAGSTVIMS